MSDTKSLILTALRKFVGQRPGMDPRNYDSAGYRAESRSVTRDAHHAYTLLDAVERDDRIGAADILKAAKSAYSGRLSIEVDGSAALITYCTGQYWPTEYRKAVAAVAASALWDAQRADMPEPTGFCVASWDRNERFVRVYQSGTFKSESEARAHLEKKGGQKFGYVESLYGRNLSAGGWLRAHFRNRFGKAIAARYFN